MTIGDPQSFNRYSYVNNDPVNLVDPLGLMLSDIGIVQTDDPEDAQIAEHQSLRDLQLSANRQASESWENLTGIHGAASTPSTNSSAAHALQDVILPTDPDALAAVFTLMHEHTSFSRLGQNEWNDAGTEQTGPEITWSTLQREASAIVYAISLMTRDFRRASWEDLIRNTGYATTARRAPGYERSNLSLGEAWYRHGRDLAMAAIRNIDGRTGQPDSNVRTYLIMAIKVATYIKEVEPSKHLPVGWNNAWLGRSGGGIALPRGSGAIGDSYFFYKNPFRTK